MNFNRTVILAIGDIGDAAQGGYFDGMQPECHIHK